jgi:uncharacterized protein (TIGR02145 family)
MKKLLSIAAVCLLGQVCFAQTTSTSSVVVTPITADYTAAPPTVTFKVFWPDGSRDATHSSKVWVLVDYRRIQNSIYVGNWLRADITVAAEAITATTGTVSREDGNTKGFWLEGPASGAFAATVTVPVTVDLNGYDPQFAWCGVASDQPPKMLSNNSGTLTLGGTPPFVLSDASGLNTYPVSGSTVTAQEIFDAGVTPIYITDLTGCTGLLNFGTPVLQGSCTFTQPPVVNNFADFPADYSASTFVSLIDERDWKVYTAVKIGGRWWMGQNLNYQTGLTYWNKHSSPSTVAGSNAALRGGFWCPADNNNNTPVAVCDYWGAFYAWETAMMLDGKGAWTEVSGSYCTGAASSANCNVNHGRKYSTGTTIGGRGICPPNWHVPTDFEWGQLLDAMESDGGTTHQTTTADGSYIGTNAGTRGKASCSGTSGDTNPVWDSGAGTDVFNFRVIAGDDRNPNGINDGSRGLYAVFWSSAAYGESNAWNRDFGYANAGVFRRAANRSLGYSVRCVRD